MSRKKGLLNISANFEPQIASPFDSRTVVDTFSDLTNPSTFVSTDSNSYVYKGLVVSVVNDPGAGNGVYLLKGLPSTDKSNWEKLGSSMPIDAPEYDAEATYNVGDVIVYISPQAEFLPEGNPFKEEALYECISPADIGEDPESYPNKWRYLGKVGEVDGSTTIIQIPGLSGELENRVKYSDISRNLKVTSDKKVEVDISYITVNGYSPVEDIQPGIGEVKINNTIWKTKNETWNDGGEGIFFPNGDEGNVEEYGYLYTPAAIERLLLANPGYRLPDLIEDIHELFQLYPRIPAIIQEFPIFNNVINAGDIATYKEGWWGEVPSETITNSSGLGLVPAGSMYPASTQVVHYFIGFKTFGTYWGKIANKYVVADSRYPGYTELSNLYGESPTAWYFPLGLHISRYGHFSGNSLSGTINTGVGMQAFSLRLVKDI